MTTLLCDSMHHKSQHCSVIQKQASALNRPPGKRGKAGGSTCLLAGVFWGLIKGSFVWEVLGDALKSPGRLRLPLLWRDSERSASPGFLGFPRGCIDYVQTLSPGLIQYILLI